MAKKPELPPADEAAYLRWLADDLQDNGTGNLTWRLVTASVLTARADKLAPANRARPKGNAREG